MAKKSISPRDKGIIYSLYLEGKKQSKIADLFEVSQSTVSLVIKEMKYEHKINKLESNVDIDRKYLK